MRTVPLSGPDAAGPDLPPWPADQRPEPTGTPTGAGGSSTADGDLSEAALLSRLARVRDRVFADWSEGPFDPPA
jgi:hypothetical protein